MKVRTAHVASNHPEVMKLVSSGKWHGKYAQFRMGLYISIILNILLIGKIIYDL